MSSADGAITARPSAALWIPTVWLLVTGSRSVSEWSSSGEGFTTAAQVAQSKPVDAAVFSILIALGLLILNYRVTEVRRLLSANLPLLAFFSYCALSVAWSDDPGIAMKRWIKAVGDVVMVLVVLTDPKPLPAIKQLFARVAIVLLPLSVILIFFFPSIGTFYDSSNGMTYYSGVATQKNTLGQTCMVYGLGSLWCFLEAYEQRWGRYRARNLMLYGGLLITAIWLIVKANSMTSLSCLGLAGVVMVLSTRRWVTARGRGLHVLVGGCLAVAVFAVFLDSAGSLLHSIGRNATLTGRTGVWKAVLAVHTNPLVGTGFESFWLGSRLKYVWDHSDYGILQAHNGYLEIYINLGLIGVLLLGLLIVNGYRRTFTVFLCDPETGRLGVAFVAASFIFSLTEAGFRILNPIWFVFLLSITALPLPLMHNKPQPARSSATLFPDRARIL